MKQKITYDPALHKVAQVAFSDNGKTYAYFYPRDVVIHTGDRILVVSPYNGVTTVTVKATGLGLQEWNNSTYAIKPIYGIIAQECNVWDINLSKAAEELEDLKRLRKDLREDLKKIEEAKDAFVKMKNAQSKSYLDAAYRAECSINLTPQPGNTTNATENPF